MSIIILSLMYKTVCFYTASSVNKLNVPFNSSWKSLIDVPAGHCYEGLRWPLTSAAPVSAGGKWMQQKISWSLELAHGLI